MSIVALWILLLMYICLTLLYAITKATSTKIPPWPVLSVVDPSQSVVVENCENNSDCPETHVCLGNRCVPKFSRGDDCNVHTGRWISYPYRGATFAICVCLYPNLIDQKHFGGNCDVNVGCGIHGHYIPREDICECDPGYIARDDYSCEKLPAAKIPDSCDGPDEIKVSEIKPSDGFHEDYVESLNNKNIKCVKRPCSFDVLSGSPLKRAKYVDGWGCVCDPRYGLFGVVLEGSDKKYLSSPGYDGCASIFNHGIEPNEPMPVELMTYFYLGTQEPVSLIKFGEESVTSIPALKGKFPLIVSQKLWMYDYSQYFFNNTRHFRARTRRVYSATIFEIERVNEWLYENRFSIIHCSEIPYRWRFLNNRRVDAYELLYGNPVCRIHDEPFNNRVVVNPQHITFKRHSNLNRQNAFVLYYDGERWTLDLDDYNTDIYMNVETNAPYYYVPGDQRPRP